MTLIKMNQSYFHIAFIFVIVKTFAIAPSTTDWEFVLIKPATTEFIPPQARNLKLK